MASGGCGRAEGAEAWAAGRDTSVKESVAAAAGIAIRTSL